MDVGTSAALGMTAILAPFICVFLRSFAVKMFLTLKTLKKGQSNHARKNCTLQYRSPHPYCKLQLRSGCKSRENL